MWGLQFAIPKLFTNGTPFPHKGGGGDKSLPQKKISNLNLTNNFEQQQSQNVGEKSNTEFPKRKQYLLVSEVNNFENPEQLLHMN